MNIASIRKHKKPKELISLLQKNVMNAQKCFINHKLRVIFNTKIIAVTNCEQSEGDCEQRGS